MAKLVLSPFLFLIALAGAFALSLPSLLHLAGLHPDYEGPEVSLEGSKRALIITTSHSVLSEAGSLEGPPTGVAASELTHPYYNFRQAGMTVDLASIRGGEIPIDPQTLRYPAKSPEDERFLKDPELQAKVRNSAPVAEVDFEDYDIIFLSGGWGAAYDLGQSAVLAEKISDAYYSPRTPLIGGVCHGVLGLLEARDREGLRLIAGRKMTGVSDKQIRELGIEVTPLHPETELRKAGAIYESSTAFRDIFATHVVVDDEARFVTGQNQNSGHETSHTMMALLAERGQASSND